MEIAERFNTSAQTISKWKNRDFTKDVSSKPKSIKYDLTTLEKALAISLRKSTWSPLDKIWESLIEVNPKKKFGLSLF